MSDLLTTLLATLAEELALVIDCAIADPLQLTACSFSRVESACQKLICCSQISLPTTQNDLYEANRLVWTVRQRSGRLKMLLESAFRFYTACLFSSPLPFLAYGVQGEWAAESCDSVFSVAY